MFGTGWQWTKQCKKNKCHFWNVFAAITFTDECCADEWFLTQSKDTACIYLPQKGYWFSIGMAMCSLAVKHKR